MSYEGAFVKPAEASNPAQTRTNTGGRDARELHRLHVPITVSVTVRELDLPKVSLVPVGTDKAMPGDECTGLQAREPSVVAASSRVGSWSPNCVRS